MKPKKQTSKRSVNKSRAGPGQEPLMREEYIFFEDTEEKEISGKGQGVPAPARNQDRKRINRRKAHEIREQLTEAGRIFHSSDVSDMFKRAASKGNVRKKQTRVYQKNRRYSINEINNSRVEEQSAKGQWMSPSEQTAQKTQKLPGNKEYLLEKQVDSKTGRTSYKMVLNRRRDSNVTRGISKVSRNLKEAPDYSKDLLHDPNREEDDNSGTEAAEFGLGTAGYVQNQISDRISKNLFRNETVKSVFRQENLFAEKKSAKESPEKTKKALQKHIQKKRIKREYAKAIRARVSAQNSAGYAQKAVYQTVSAIQKLSGIIISNIHMIIIAGVIALLLFLVIIMVSSCAAMFNGGLGNVMAGSYQTLPSEIDKAENSMTLKEMQLQNKIDRIETEYPDYDDYTYNLDPIEHDPFTLINFLSAKYIDFTASDVESDIQYLFDHMYQLILTEREEKRTRTVTKIRHVIDPETGLETDEEEEYEEEEEYIATILDVKLTAIPLELIIRLQLQGETAELYAIYKETKGEVQRFYTPLNTDWQRNIKSYYGYRKNSRTGANEFHKGLDISVPYGTNVYASQSGIVTETAYDEDHDNYIVIEDSKGYMTKYAHLSTRYVSVGQTVENGQLIGRTGSTGSITGSHLHIECLYNGEHYNPFFYFENGDTGTHTLSDTTGYATEAYAEDITDTDRNILLKEAANYLGYPYIWGGNSPEEGFDCSGFVCYVLKNSGYVDMPRTTAQGIYNSCRSIDPAEAQPGDIIFFTGTYNSGGPVSHVGIYCGNGMMIHAGDPIKYSQINTPYWQSHFFGFGRPIR